MAANSIQRRIALLAVCALLATGCASGGSVQSLGFGSGGASCDITGTTSTFARGQLVHMAATFSDPPKHVDIEVTRDGLKDDHSGSIDLGETENCVIANFDDLVAGHYVVTLTPVPALSTPPLSGAFEVTP